jgi:transcriptional regulator with XRE-family HTH domain
MRTAFGRFAMSLRAAKGISQTDFCRRIGLSLPRVSNIEHGRVAVSTDVVNSYITALNCSGVEAHELMKLADFSNTRRSMSESGAQHPSLLALFKQFGDRISPKAAADIQRILELETGERVSVLTLASNRMSSKGKATRASKERYSLLPKRFAEICFTANEVRRLVTDDLVKVNFETSLEKLGSSFHNFDYDVLETLPSFAQGAFACIIGEKDGNTLLVEEERFAKAIIGVYFARHALAHEIGHHVLHPHLLLSDGSVYIAPQALAKNTAESATSNGRIYEIIDTLEEAEAEAFATLFLVPWEAFFKGTSATFLRDDFGEELETIKTFSFYFKNRAILEALASELVRRGCRHHPVFERLRQLS